MWFYLIIPGYKLCNDVNIILMVWSRSGVWVWEMVPTLLRLIMPGLCDTLGKFSPMLMEIRHSAAMLQLLLLDFFLLNPFIFSLSNLLTMPSVSRILNI